MIKARIPAENPGANLKSYARTYKQFSWADAEKAFSWPKTGKLNIVHEAIDRWAEHAEKRDHTALIFEKEDNIRSFTYVELKERSCQWAYLLAQSGLKTGDRFFIFLPPCPEIYFALLACSRLGVIFCPLYSTLGFDELEVRIKDAEPRGILTHPDLAERLPVESMSSVKAAVIDENGVPLPFLTMGELALKVPWPSVMIGLWRDEDRYQSYFRLKDWFLTGDMAIEDEEGYDYHQGRTDDLIKVGEKMIGSYEIEQTLCQHPAVHEAAVISKRTRPGRPQLKGFVTVHKDYTPSNRLNQEIKAFVKANLSPDAPLREIEFLDQLPKTGAGKLLRRVLKARELGLPGGDPSQMKA